MSPSRRLIRQDLVAEVVSKKSLSVESHLIGDCNNMIVFNNFSVYRKLIGICYMWQNVI